MNEHISRREFLKLFSLSICGLILPDLGAGAFPWLAAKSPPAPMLGRITRRAVDVRAEPDIQSPRLEQVKRDAILPLLEEIISPSGPKENPRWYRLEKGYIHSAYVQRVEKAHLNAALNRVPETGLLGEVTVPYTQTLYKYQKEVLVKLYRLYFQSQHWITGLIDGPDGKPWYRLTDEWLRVHYYAPAQDIRPIPAGELEPLSPAG